MSILFLVFEIIGAIAFSISGAITAIKKKMDLLGVLSMGVVTSIGGGVVRDVLLGQCPPKAFLNLKYPMIAVITAMITWFLEQKSNKKHPMFKEKMLLLMDSIGLGFFTVVGIEVTQDACGFNPLLAVLMGVITGTGGGVIRDVFSCQIPYIFSKHFYATASIIGSIIYLLCSAINNLAAEFAGMFIIILFRLCASKYRWNLPKAE